MDWVYSGWIYWGCIVFVILYSSYTTKLKKLQKKVEKLSKKQKGSCVMSNIITSLIGKNCKIRTDETLMFSGSIESDCSVLDADDEWIKVSYVDRKGISKIKIIRIDSISNIEITEE